MYPTKEERSNPNSYDCRLRDYGSDEKMTKGSIHA